MKPAVAPSSSRLPWALARLRLGQTNVGLWVVAAVAAVVLTPVLDNAPLAVEAGTWAGLLSVYIALQAPFDVIGGYLLPVAHDRRPVGLTRWMRSWLAGVLLHAVTLFTLGVGALAVGRAFGDAAALALCIAAGVLVTLAQGGIATALSIETSPPEDPVLRGLTDAGLDAARARVVQTDDSGFVGGWVGFPGREVLLVPSRWAGLAPSELHAVLVRRRLGRTSGSRTRGLLGALAFNACGAGLVLGLLPQAGFQSASSLLVTSAGFTLWAFLGILTLPSISRGAVTTLDRATVRALGDTRWMASAITSLDQLQEDELRRPPLTETVFHPVPARASRIAALNTPNDESLGAWRITRMALFGGWAHFSWLSRSVHCNIGRPELWAVYPGD